MHQRSHMNLAHVACSSRDVGAEGLRRDIQRGNWAKHATFLPKRRPWADASPADDDDNGCLEWPAIGASGFDSSRGSRSLRRGSELQEGVGDDAEKGAGSH